MKGERSGCALTNTNGIREEAALVTDLLTVLLTVNRRLVGSSTPNQCVTAASS